MQAATRRNLVLLALGTALLLLLWHVPGRPDPSAAPGGGILGPRPTPTVESRWRVILELEGQGARDLCSLGQEVTVPGPWRIRATPQGRPVQVRVLEPRDLRLFARVWAAGADYGELATLPQGNGTYCLQVEAEGAYTLYVEAWEAPPR